MAGSLILDDDLLVLQRQGDFDIKDEFYETKFPGQFPNIRIDTDIFHFTGEDLRYSCEEYIMDSGKFVRIDGDSMTGDLVIDTIPENGLEGASTLTLVGERTGGLPCAQIKFTNKETSSNRTQTIQAIAPVNNTHSAHLKIADQVAITEHGEILMSGGRHHVCGLNGGEIKAITNDSWDVDQGIITNPLESNSTRLKWHNRGGELWSQNGQVVLWDDVGFYVRGSSETLFRVVDTFARYTGLIEHKFDITHKEYVDGQDKKYIPLKGTRATVDDLGYPLEQQEVTGPIDFTEEGCLNATFGSRLIFKRNESIKLTVGGELDPDVHIHNCDINFHDNKLLNVPDPDTSASNTDAKNAVPKRYIDELIQAMQDQYDNIADIAAPPGMINAYTGSANGEPPTGWFFCTGGKYVAKTHEKMHRALGGSDSDWANNPTFEGTLPNLGGRFLAQIGALNNSSNTKPFGSSNTRSYNNQKTSEPTIAGYRGDSNNVSNNIVNRMHTKDAGFHFHEMNFWDHTHHVGSIKAEARLQKQASNDNGGSGGGEYTEAYNGRESLDSARKLRMSGDTSFADPPATSAIQNQGYTNTSNRNRYETGGLKYTQIAAPNHTHYIGADQWDTYTLPYTYTVMWIIKHDNIVTP